jgi:hypothetical protein
MPKRRDDIDWYVDMSDRLERREARRKWVILGFCVFLPLVVLGIFTGLAVLHERGILAQWRTAFFGDPATQPEQTKEVILPPVSVKAFQTGDIKFAQLDNDGMVLSVTHYFREALPDGADVFTVNRDSDDHGAILSYRLKNPGTLDVFDFKDIEVSRVGGEWTITEDGWKKIRDDLRTYMKVSLGRPML